MLRVGLRRAVAPLRAEAAVASAGTTGGVVRPVSLENLEARWPTLSNVERAEHYKKISEVIKRDWKTLSLEEKRSALFVSYGSLKPKPSDTPQVVGGVAACIVLSLVSYFIIRSFGKEPPRTMNKEWQLATNEKMLKQKANPLTGISSKGYKGPGFVQ